MEEQDEQWRAVPEWEGLYEVSDRGRVRSLSRSVERDFVWGRGSVRGRGFQNFTGRVISVYQDKGRPIVRISGRGRRATLAVHRMVAAAFLGPKPRGHEVAHNNGDAHDNRVENLRYATPIENAADKVRHGTLPLGMSAHNSVLTDAQVLAARAVPKGQVRAFAESIGVKPRLLYQVRSRETWRHI